MAEQRENTTQENRKKRRFGKWTRRAFLGVGGLTGVGLVVGIGGMAYMKNAVKKFSGAGMGEGSSLNAWIRISPENVITVAVPRAEMGQGVNTAIPQLIAEELEVEMSQIEVIHPQPESPYANTFLLTQTAPNVFKRYSLMETVLSFLPLIVTGGSSSIGDAWNNMRMAGATARESLLKAAAKRWEISESDCYADKGHIINRKNNERLTYGALAEDAAEIKISQLPELKPRSKFKVIGKSVPRLDIPEKVNGNAVYGLDVRLDGMLYASVRHASTIGGKITEVSNESDILKMPGVKKVIVTDYGPAIVIADNTWRAINASKELEVEEDGANADLSSTNIQVQLEEVMDKKPLKVMVNEGNVKNVFDAEGGTHLKARYEVPYLAHAALEPLNCTVLVKDGKAEAWVGHQAPSTTLNMIAESTGIDSDDTTINITYLGGGFGRRGEPDFVRYAGVAAKAMEGTPVQLVFSREEDMRNDMYRPAAISDFEAKVNENGEIDAWYNMMALQSVEASAFARLMPALAPAPEDAKSTSEGADNLPYTMNNQKVAFGDLTLPIEIGFWRSVGYSQNSFFTESFIDECAHAAKQDPYLFRKSKLKEKPRHAAVLDKVAAMANWRSPLGEGKSRGIALVESFNSIVAEVVELSHVEEKTFKIDKVYCAVDCGNFVNPEIVEDQMRSGIIFGLTAALHGEITWSEGAVEQGNFPEYEMMRMNACPEIVVEIMDVDEYPGGVGEPGTPPAAPALTNAIFAATQNRVRSLPLSKSGYKFV